MLKTDTSPRIATVIPEGQDFYFQQDLAISHTAKSSTEWLGTQPLTLVPWAPSGADLSPLDIFVNPELKKRLRGKDMETVEKMTAATSRALSEMAEGPEFKKGLKKCCRGIKKRVQWVAAHGGRISTSELVRNWVAQESPMKSDE